MQVERLVSWFHATVCAVVSCVYSSLSLLASVFLVFYCIINLILLPCH